MISCADDASSLDKLQLRDAGDTRDEPGEDLSLISGAQASLNNPVMCPIMYQAYCK